MKRVVILVPFLLVCFALGICVILYSLGALGEAVGNILVEAYTKLLDWSEK